MRVLITTFGTRGDIQPFIALGKGLKAAGYETAICTSEGFKSFVEEHEVPYLFMDNELLRLSQAALGENHGEGSTLSVIRKMVPAMRHSMDDEWKAALAFQPDLIIYHPKCLGSYHVAEKLQIPAMMALPLPFYTPTRAFPVPFFSGLHLGGAVNYLSYKFMALSSAMYGGTVNDFRAKTLGLAPISRFADLLVRSDGSPVPVLYAYSAHILPIPDDFPAHVYVTGYWFLDHSNGWQPKAELVQFLQAGPPPVYIGFGSMGHRKGEQRTRIILDAVEKSGMRGLLASGWGGLKASDLPDKVYMLESVPHDWLFPQVAAVVHHGGAGTTAAGLRAGKPSIICPFIADQPFWGRLIDQRGVGPKPIPQSQLTGGRLADAITAAVNDEAMQHRAAELGQTIRAEDGIAHALEVIGAAIGKPERQGAAEN
ncbi:MAG: glycosyltransferase [Anaerolineae bacterium]|nr:glycosyltransferase [Anaerolineae bacterium]